MSSLLMKINCLVQSSFQCTSCSFAITSFLPILSLLGILLELLNDVHILCRTLATLLFDISYDLQMTQSRQFTHTGTYCSFACNHHSLDNVKSPTISELICLNYSLFKQFLNLELGCLTNPASPELHPSRHITSPLGRERKWFGNPKLKNP